MIYLYHALQTLIFIISAILGVILLFLLLCFVCSLFVRNKEYEKHGKFYRYLLNTFTAMGLWLLRVRIKVEGEEKLEGIERFLIVSNHRANLDPIATYYALKKHDVAFLSKKENFKVVIFGKIIRKCCFRAIDRENPRNAIKTIRDSAELIKADQVSIGVYPEGTRSKTGELLPFHDGVFKIASLASVPVVIATIRGGENFKKKYPFRRTIINLHILEVVNSERVKELSTHEIASYAREKIENDLA